MGADNHPTVNVMDEMSSRLFSITSRFTCQCGERLPADERCECSKCGAHYERRTAGGVEFMYQVAPPIGKE